MWLAGFGAFSMMVPRDASFDVAHYHLHNGWAALNGREGYDLAPAEMHSFLNPVWQMFIWGLIELFPGRAVAFILGVLQGLILPGLYALTRRLLAQTEAKPGLLTVMAIAVAGFGAECQFGLLGSVRNDAVFACGLLGALVLLFPDNRQVPTLPALGLASLLVGALMGMKLTNAVYVLFFAVTAMIVMPNWNSRIRAALVCSVAGLAGILIFGGPWAWQMYQTYGNPIFPNLNGYFDAPMGPETPFRDTRYLPHGLGEALLRPFAFLFNGELINEHDFFDPRFLFTYLCSFVMVGLSLPKLRQAGSRISRSSLALSIGALAAIFAWILVFSIARYMSLAWLIGPTMLALTIGLLKPQWLSHKRAPLGAIGAATLLLVTTQPAELRRVPWTGWSEPYVSASLPEGRDYSNAIVAFSGGYPGAFLAPYFPAETRMAHLVPQDWSAPALENYRQQIRDLITSNTHDLYVVIADTEGHVLETQERLSTKEKITFDISDCQPIASSFSSPGAGWIICPAQAKTSP